MSEPILIYRVRVSGFWSTRHTIEVETPEGGREPVGTLDVRRNLCGMVVRGEYRPEKGEVLTFRRDPGLLRSQFSVWTEGREWLGSALRWGWAKRTIEVSTATSNKAYHMVPHAGWKRGWRLIAPKTGEAARMRAGLLGRSTRIEVFRRLDADLVVLTHFIGWQILVESLWPGVGLTDEFRASKPSKA
jgi:hypothetical protein